MEKIIKEISKKGKIQCYESSQMAFDDKKTFDKTIEKRISLTKIRLRTYLEELNTKNYVSRFEIRIFSKNKIPDKNKYNFTQREKKFIFKEDYTRLFVHSFNIISTNGNILVAQSWFDKQKYDVIYELKDVDLFLEMLEKSINNFSENPEMLFKLFQYKNDDTETLFNFIKNEVKETKAIVQVKIKI